MLVGPGAGLTARLGAGGAGVVPAAAATGADLRNGQAAARARGREVDELQIDIEVEAEDVAEQRRLRAGKGRAAGLGLRQALREDVDGVGRKRARSPRAGPRGARRPRCRSGRRPGGGGQAMRPGRERDRERVRTQATPFGNRKPPPKAEARSVRWIGKTGAGRDTQGTTGPQASARKMGQKRAEGLPR